MRIRYLLWLILLCVPATAQIRFDQLAPPSGCTNGQVPTWNAPSFVWTCTTPTGTGGSPGGSDTQVQFNDATAFGGIPSVTYIKATPVLKIQAGAKFLFTDPTDTTKAIQLDLSGITTSTTRTGTLPNANFTFVVPFTCSNQVATAASSSGTFTCNTITSAYTSGTFPATAHALLSTTHSDTTAAAPVRGDGIFAIGVTPTWQRVAHPSVTGGYFKWNGTDIVTSTLAASGTGSPTACSNQVVTAFTLVADAAPTSTCTTVTSAFTSGTFAPNAHSLLGASHSDTLAHAVVLGDMLFGNGTPAWAALAGNITGTKKFLTQTGTGAVSAAPAWGTILGTDLPTPAAASLGGVDSKDCTGTGHVLSVNTDGSITCSADAGGGSGSPGGVNTNVQFNDSGSFGGDPGLVYDKVSDVLSVGTIPTFLQTFNWATQTANRTVTWPDSVGPGVPQMDASGNVTYNNNLAPGNRVLTLDGVQYTTLQGLLTAANSLCTGSTNCIIDARYPGLTTQTLTSGALPAVPTTLLTGPYTIQYDMTAFTGLQPSSSFHWVAENTTLTNTSLDPASQACTTNTPISGMISPVVTTTTASTTAGSTTVTVASATGIQPETMVAILGKPFNGSGTGAYQIGTQSTTISNAAGQLIGDTSMTVASTTNFGPASNSANYYDYLYVGTEIEQYTGSTSTTFTSMTRGLFGTSAAAHAQNVIAYQLGWYVCEVVSVSGTTLTCVDAAPISVTSAPAQVGSTDISIEGNLTLDGHLDNAGHVQPTSGCSQPTGFGLWLTSHLNIGTSVQITNLDDGISAFMSRRNTLRGDFSNVGIIGPLTTTAASLTTNVVTLTLNGSPITNGYVAGGTLVVSGFTGADTYFNGSFTLVSVTSTQVTYNLTHANGSATTNGQTVQTSPANYNGGWDIGLFNSNNNNFDTQGHSGGYFQTLFDDRSIIAGPYDGPSSFNSGRVATDDGAKYRYGCVDIEGSSGFNRIDMGYCNASNTALQLITSGQWTTDPNQTGNTVYVGSLDSTSQAVNIADQNSGVTRDNVYIGLINTGVITVPTTGRDFVCFSSATQPYNCMPYQSGNAYLWSMQRSGSSHGFADICGNTNCYGNAANSTWVSGDVLLDGVADKYGQSSIVAASAAINTTDTIIVKTPALAASRLQAGTTIRIVLIGTCTSTAANISTFTVRWGTNGTTADGTVAAIATSVAATSGTNTGFKAAIDLVVRTAGASATSEASMDLESDANLGIVATQNVKLVAGTAFNTTTANGILSVSYKSAATTTTTTFQQAFIYVFNK